MRGGGEPGCGVVLWGGVAEGGGGSGFGDESVDDGVGCPGVTVVVDGGGCGCLVSIGGGMDLVVE